MLKEGGLTKCHMNLFAFLNTVYNSFGSKKPCLTPKFSVRKVPKSVTYYQKFSMTYIDTFKYLLSVMNDKQFISVLLIVFIVSVVNIN